MGIVFSLLGMKDAFLEWARIEFDDGLESAVRFDCDLASHTSIMLRCLIRKVRVALWSDLPKAAFSRNQMRNSDCGLTEESHSAFRNPQSAMGHSAVWPARPQNVCVTRTSS